MKLIRFGAIGQEKPGVQLKDGKKIDVSAFGQDYTEAFFGGEGLEDLKTWLEENASQCPTIGNEMRLGAPLVRPSKIVCVGLNYAQHAAESGLAVPKEPVLFFKSTSAIVGPNDA